MDTSTKPDRLLPEREAQERLGGISRTAIWELRRDGLLHGVKIGKRLLYPESEIERFIASLKAGAA